MGTATLTRSQSRKTRSTFTSEANDRALSSPLEVIQGNYLRSSSRRHIPKPLATSSSVEKENAPPSLTRWQNMNSSPVQLPDPKLPKAIKKRKQSTIVPEGLSNRTENSSDASLPNVASGSFEAPIMIDNEHTRVKHDPQMTVAEPSFPVTKNQAILHSTVPDEGDPVRKASSNCALDERNEVPSKEKGIDHNAGIFLSGTSALALLQKDYEKLYRKYQKQKIRRFDEVEALYGEQNSRITAFMQATEDLVDFYKHENSSLREQIQEANIPELLDRCKWLEKANAECRSDLLREQSKSLEFRHENKRLKSLLLEQVVVDKQTVPLPAGHIGFTMDTNKKHGDDSTPSGHFELVQQLLESVLGLQLSFLGDGVDAQLHFQHCPTGFSFNLRVVHDIEIAELVGGGELMYQNVSLGVCKKAVDWMKEKEVVFGMDQAQLLFKKLIRFLNRGIYG